MSQQRQPTLNDVELKYHDSKTNTDALVATLIREYKGNLDRLMQENNMLQAENKALKEKLELDKKKVKKD